MAYIVCADLSTPQKRCKAISQLQKHKRTNEGSISSIQDGSVSYGRTLQT
jgi:hypothetical protein